MGGWTVLGFASAYPERTRALVLCDTMAGVDAADLRLPVLRNRVNGQRIARQFSDKRWRGTFRSAPRR